MIDATYWGNRFAQLEDAQNKKGASFFANLEAQYNKAIKEINKDLAYWLEKDNKNLTKNEIKDLHEFIEKARGNDPKWRSQLEKAKIKYNIDRLEFLKLQVQEQIEFLGDYQLNGMNELLKDVYTDSYYKTAYTLQHGIKIAHNFNELNTDYLNKVLSKSWGTDYKNFSDRIWENKTKLVNELNNTLAQHIARGTDPTTIISEFTKKMNNSRFNCGRVIMTETAFYSNTANMDSMSKLGVEKYEILSTLDGKTSKICQDMDGKVFSIKDFEIGVNAPPFHPFCRTCTIPYFEDAEDIVRVAKDENNEGYYKLRGDTTYKEWKDVFVEKKKENDFKPIGISDIPSIIADNDVLKELIGDNKSLVDAYNNIDAEIEKTHDKFYNMYDEIDDLEEEIRKYKLDKEFNKPVDPSFNLSEKESKLNNLRNELEKLKKQSKELVNKKNELPHQIHNNILKVGEELTKDFDTVFKNEKIEGILKRYNVEKDVYEKYLIGLELEQENEKYYIKNREFVINRLKTIRNIGGLDTSKFVEGHKIASGYVAQAYNFYPKDWILNSYHKNIINVGVAKRGYYSHVSSTICLSNIKRDYKALGTSTHELGHRFSHTMPMLNLQEHLFYKRRTEGEELRWLGVGYKRNEKGRKDHFVDRYIGKDYGDGHNYEVLSMGFEYAYNNIYMIKQDKDYLNFIFGVLGTM